jgi:hypothetical protein
MRFYAAAIAYCIATFLLYVLIAELLSDSPDLLAAMQIGAPGDNPLGELKLSRPVGCRADAHGAVAEFPGDSPDRRASSAVLQDARQHPARGDHPERAAVP